MKKRKIKKNVLIAAAVLIGIVLLLIVNTNFSFIGKRSIHEDAKRYKTRHCLVFYPDSKLGSAKAKEMCKGVKDDRIFDYMLIPYGDYYLVSYGGGNSYLTDKEYGPVELILPDEKGMQIIADHLHYSLKKDRPDLYYDPDLLSRITAEKLDPAKISYELTPEGVDTHFSEFDLDVRIPLKDYQKASGMDLGYPDDLYVCPVYIDPDEENHPIICLTFDDGPQFWYSSGNTGSEKIVDLLHRYDGNGTFYVVGSNLQNREVWSEYEAYDFLKRSIANGNEYGSHTQTHKYALTDLSSAQEIFDEINGPIAFMKNLLGYEMKTYRPVEGAIDDDVMAAQPVCAVLWDVDSQDWYYRDADEIYEQVMSEDLDSGDIIIFHDIYDETAEALERILPEFVKRGYQLVTVSDMMAYYGQDIGRLKYIYSATDCR